MFMARWISGGTFTVATLLSVVERVFYYPNLLSKVNNKDKLKISINIKLHKQK